MDNQDITHTVLIIPNEDGEVHFGVVEDDLSELDGSLLYSGALTREALLNHNYEPIFEMLDKFPTEIVKQHNCAVIIIHS